MDPLPRVVIKTDARPLVCEQTDGEYVLEFADAGVAVVLNPDQLRAIVDSFLASTLGVLDD